MTNLYVKQKLSSFTASSNDLIRFFGITLFSDYHKVAKEDNYWSKSKDLSNNTDPKIMPCHKKFFSLS